MTIDTNYQNDLIWYEIASFNNSNMYFWDGGDGRTYACPYDRIGEFNSLPEYGNTMTESWNNLSSGLVELNKRGVRLYVFMPSGFGCGWWRIGAQNFKVTGCNSAYE